MIFYQKGNVAIWDGQKAVPFVNGKIEVNNPDLIRRLKAAGYRSDDDGRHTEQRDEEGQEAEKEPTFNELRAQAKEKGLTGYGKMNKAELLDALEEGD